MEDYFFFFFPNKEEFNGSCNIEEERRINRFYITGRKLRVMERERESTCSHKSLRKTLIVQNKQIEIKTRNWDQERKVGSKISIKWNFLCIFIEIQRGGLESKCMKSEIHEQVGGGEREREGKVEK